NFQFLYYYFICQVLVLRFKSRTFFDIIYGYWSFIRTRIFNLSITDLFLLYTMNKTEMDVGEIYYNNDGIQGALMMQQRILSQKVNLEWCRIIKGRIQHNASKFSVVSVSFCLVLNGFSFSFMNSLLTISGMM
uniref:Uncharacterized protein n=1 Tax=Strongyloides stercoralis TaxID=6248 RepID=A0AAF5HYW7_STRER